VAVCVQDARMSFDSRVVLFSLLGSSGPLEFERPLARGQELLTSISNLSLATKKIEVLPLGLSRVQLPVFVRGKARELQFIARQSHSIGYSLSS